MSLKPIVEFGTSGDASQFTPQNLESIYYCLDLSRQMLDGFLVEKTGSSMFDSEQYQLIDFGEGRKLERFGQFILDRPAPAADGKRKSNPSIWKTADTRFTRTSNDNGRWSPAGEMPTTWEISHAIGTIQLKPTDFGHVGVFPEQAANWDWIANQVRRSAKPLKVLNLFGYTGGATLAAASEGAEVVHVDAAKNIVAWARLNAELSGLFDAPIRWIFWRRHGRIIRWNFHRIG